jgi:hypothetical protein
MRGVARAARLPANESSRREETAEAMIFLPMNHLTLGRRSDDSPATRSGEISNR